MELNHSVSSNSASSYETGNASFSTKPCTHTKIKSDIDSTDEEEISSTASSSSSLQSLAKFLHYNCRSLHGEYNAFATSYIITDIPSLPFSLDDTESFRAVTPPFKGAVKVKEFECKVKRRQELGQSSRCGKIIPNSKLILQEIQTEILNHAQSPENQSSILLHKARKWCEINKALLVDTKYPKISPQVIREKYSEEHKTTCHNVKKIQGLSDKNKVFRRNSCALLASTKESVEEHGGENETILLQKETKKLEHQLHDIFGKVNPILDLKASDDLPWQFVAKKTTRINPKTVKRPPFRRTVYPPISQRETITEMRNLSLFKSREMEKDYLSGIWEPELDIDEFNISQLHENTIEIDRGVEIDWFTMSEAKEKCKRWLESAPDTF